MSETQTYAPYLARERFSREVEADFRRRQPGGSSRKVTDWCVRNLHQIVPREGQVLDLACGNGRHFPELAGPGIRVIGGDLSLPMLIRARSHGGSKSLVCFEAEGLPFKADSFDGILSARFLHHIPTRDIRSAILGEMFRAAKSAVAITYKAELSGEHLRHLVKCATRKVKPQRYFNRLEEFQSIAAEHGWAVTEVFIPQKRLSSNRGLLFEPV